MTVSATLEMTEMSLALASPAIDAGREARADRLKPLLLLLRGPFITFGPGGLPRIALLVRVPTCPGFRKRFKARGRVPDWGVFSDAGTADNNERTNAMATVHEDLPPPEIGLSRAGETGGATSTGRINHDGPLLMDDNFDGREETFCRPCNGNTGGSGPWEFTIPASNHFLMLPSLCLEMTVKVTKGDGTDLQNDDFVAPINLLGQTMWESVAVTLNDTPINPRSSANTNYKSYIETVLSSRNSAALTRLKSQVFYPDSGGRFNRLTYANDAMGAAADNEGFRVRRGLFTESRANTLMVPVCADFLHSDKHLAPHNRLTLRFTRAPDNFVLMAANVAEGYKLEISDLKLHFIRLKTKTPLTFRKERYLSTRTELRRIAIPQNETSFHATIQQAGRLPKSIIFGLVHSAALEGAYNRNPFFFHHHALTSVNLRVGGVQVPLNPYEPNFLANPPKVYREYNALVNNLGGLYNNRGLLIPPEEFVTGYTFFAYDLSPDLCNGRHLHPSGKGDVDLGLSFRDALAEPVTLVVHLSYDDMIIQTTDEHNAKKIEIVEL